MLQRLCTLFFMLILNTAHAENPESEAIKHLANINKFLSVAPERSRSILISYSDSVRFLDVQKKIAWHNAGATIGLKLNDLNLFETSLKRLVDLITRDNLKQHRVSSLALLGHYSLKSNFLIEAIYAYNCVYVSAENQNSKILAAYRIANAYLSAGNIDKAELIMKKLLSIAENQGKKSWFGPLKSTMGIYALHRKDYLVAEHFFVESMNAHQEIHNNSGEFNSLLNLLLTLALANSEKFERIEYRVARLSEKNKDMDRELLLKLILLLRSSKLNESDIKHKELANQYFEQIQSSTVKAAAEDFIFPALNIDIDKALPVTTPLWVTTSLKKLQCNAEAVNLKQVLADLSNIEKNSTLRKR